MKNVKADDGVSGVNGRRMNGMDVSDLGSVSGISFPTMEKVAILNEKIEQFEELAVSATDTDERLYYKKQLAQLHSEHNTAVNLLTGQAPSHPH